MAGVAPARAAPPRGDPGTQPLPPLVRHKVYAAEYVADVASDEAGLESSAVVEGTRAGTVLIGASRERVGFERAMPLPVVRRLAAQALRLFPVLADVALLRSYPGFGRTAPTTSRSSAPTRGPRGCCTPAATRARVSASPRARRTCSRRCSPAPLPEASLGRSGPNGSAGGAGVSRSPSDGASRLLVRRRRRPVRPGPDRRRGALGARRPLVAPDSVRRRAARPVLRHRRLLRLPRRGRRAARPAAPVSCRPDRGRGADAGGSGPWRPAACDVAVVGAGPAGAAAAVTAARAGARVVLSTARQRPGGQYWRHGPGRRAARRRRGRGARRPSGATSPRGSSASSPRAGSTHLPRTRVWRRRRRRPAPAGRAGLARRRTASPGGGRPDQRRRRGRRVVLAPGAHDRVLPFPGWDLPGVLTAGAGQALLKEHGVAAGSPGRGRRDRTLPAAGRGRPGRGRGAGAGGGRGRATGAAGHAAGAPPRERRERWPTAHATPRCSPGTGFPCTCARRSSRPTGGTGSRP